MRSSFLIGVEEFIVWLFDHEDEFIEKFCKDELLFIDNIYISAHTVVVIDHYWKAEGTQKILPIKDVISWIDEHEDGYE